VVRLLDAIFSRFDDLTGQSGLEKIKTIGDAYMVAAGIPEPAADHAAAAAELALRMQAAIKRFSRAGHSHRHQFGRRRRRRHRQEALHLRPVG
jgi:adenylate cyclase